MVSDNGTHYELSQTAEVTKQIKELGRKARKLGIKNRFVDALKTISRMLQSAPMQWGDPEWHPKRKGDCVCHASCSPLFVRYVVFEPERKVMLLKVQPLPKSPLA